MTTQRISGKKVAVCPVLRAGLGMLDGVLSLVSSARVGFIGLYRDEETLEPVEYYVKLPGRPRPARRDRARPDARHRQLERRRDRAGQGRRRALDHARLPRRGARGHRARPLPSIPDVRIVAAAVDRGLNEKGYIVPGLGDAGDRLYGTR